MISIVIPTCDRAHYLREALESVRKQTARHSITEVIVSENGTTNRSEDVCKEFADLPIIYVQQQPRLSSLLHFKALFPIVRSPLIAILHDDDWWAPNHLEAALDVLNSNTDCVAVYANYYETYGPQFPSYILVERVWRIWFSSGCEFPGAVQVLDDISVMLICLINGYFHYSTLVGRKEAIWDAYLKVVASGNVYDNDRTFPTFLSQHGSISYVIHPNVFVRVHVNQDSRQPVYLTDSVKLGCETIRWLRKMDPTRVSLAADKFNRTVKNLPPNVVLNDSSYLAKVFGSLQELERSTLIRECGFNPPSTEQPIQTSPRRDVKWFFKQMCPPGILALARRLATAFHTFRTKTVNS